MPGAIDSDWIKNKWMMHVEQAEHDIAAGVLGDTIEEVSRWNTAAMLHLNVAAEVRAMLVEEF